MSEYKIPIPSMIYNAAVGGHVTNSKQIIDENLNREQNDINQETVGAIPYNSITPNGMGRIVLKKNDNFKQVVEAQTNGNTIFVIKYYFTLTDNVTIPTNCVLKFDGGSINGNTADKNIITGNNTTILGENGCIKNILFSGTFKDSFYISWLSLNNSYNDYTIKALHCITNLFNNIIWDTKEIYVSFVEGYNIKIHKGTNDFNDTKFIIKNDTNSTNTLFIYNEELKDFPSELNSIEDYVESNVFTDCCGCLVINDETKITTRQMENPYDVFRKDIIFVQNNVAFNKPILPYDDEETVLKAKYFIVDYNDIVIKNVNIERDVNSVSIYKVADITNAYNVTFENVYIHTKETESTLQYDVINSFNNVYNLKVKDFTINGSHYVSGLYSYGLYLDNVANTVYNNIQVHNGWGITAGNCINKLLMKNSTIARLDAHCYSRDFTIENSTFLNYGVSLGGHFGYVICNSCYFKDGQIIYNDGSYNMHTLYNIHCNSCIFDNVTYFVRWGGNDTSYRSIIPVNCFPNIYINGADIIHSNIIVFTNTTGTYNNIPILEFKSFIIRDSYSTINISNKYHSVNLLVDNYKDHESKLYTGDYQDLNSSLITNTNSTNNSLIKIINSTINVYFLRWLFSIGYNSKITIENSILYGFSRQAVTKENGSRGYIKNCILYPPKDNNTLVLNANIYYDHCKIVGNEGFSYFTAVFAYCNFENSFGDDYCDKIIKKSENSSVTVVLDLSL